MRRIGVALLLALMLPIVSGCGTSAAKEDLELSLTDTRAAVSSAVLALDLLDRGRTTRAAAQVTTGDMVDQVGLVQQRLVQVQADTAEVSRLRQRCQLVVADALIALQDSEDVLSGSGETDALLAELTDVQHDLDDVTAEVGGR